MKRYRLLFFAVVTLFLNFLCFWYMNVLLDRYFIFCLIPVGLALLLLAVCMLASVVRVIRGRERRLAAFSLLACILTVVLIFLFPFREARVHTELALFEKDRMKVVELVKEDQLTPDAHGNISLPRKYRRTSSDGTVHVYQNDVEQVICFWVFRGMLSGSVQLMYSSQDEALIWNNETAHPIVTVERLKEHWYLVHTDY